MKRASCYFCKNSRRYFGITYCCKNPDRPVRMMTHPEECEFCASRDRHNCTTKMTQQQKDYVSDAENQYIEPGKCREHCIYWVEHLNYCAVWDWTCSKHGEEPNCLFKNNEEDDVECQE